MLCLQYFYNKSQVVSCYWFKFETNTNITFFALTITTNNDLPLRICGKNVVNISFLLLYRQKIIYIILHSTNPQLQARSHSQKSNNNQLWVC